MPSEFVMRKAKLMREADKVRRVVEARVYEVEGDHGVYLVVIGPDGMVHCTCPAAGERECSHIIAAGWQDRDEIGEEPADVPERGSVERKTLVALRSGALIPGALNLVMGAIPYEDALRQLCDAGLVAKRRGAYELTEAGREAAR